MDEYDAIVVGGSIAGCTVATFLGRQGARVALLERSPKEDAYKVICTHAILPCATLSRFGLQTRRTLNDEEGRVVYLKRSDGTLHDSPYGFGVLVHARTP